jgi:CxxC motif-containing protein
MICIVCPIGCHLSIEEGSETAAAGGALSGAVRGAGEPEGGLVVKGNRCPRGAAYAQEECLAPKRVVTATVALVQGGEPAAEAGQAGSLTAPRRVPCRTTAAFPKERAVELLGAIYALRVALPVKRGQVVLANALGTGIDVILTRTID